MDAFLELEQFFFDFLSFGLESDTFSVINPICFWKNGRNCGVIFELGLWLLQMKNKEWKPDLHLDQFKSSLSAVSC